jgi:hypothetical protein
VDDYTVVTGDSDGVDPISQCQQPSTPIAQQLLDGMSWILASMLVLTILRGPIPRCPIACHRRRVAE